MQNQISSFIEIPSGWHHVTLFGYSNQGIPGVEIIGLGNTGRLIKEKFIYLSKIRKLNIPSRRYVLCYESSLGEKKLTPEVIQWLELPLLILFWSLAEQIPILRLDDCLSSGRVLANGEIYFRDMEKAYQTIQNEKAKMIYLGHEENMIDCRELFSSIPQLQLRVHP